jgi:hypothetical protein
VQSESSMELLRAWRAFFQFTGCPAHFWCDRGGAFDSHEFRSFADSIGMRICYSSAEYPQSNGAAESAVKILKRLRKVSTTENELFRALLYLQNQAKRRHTASPAQIFLGRTVRTPLVPRTTRSDIKWERHLLERQQDQSTMKRYFDRTASRNARDFLDGDRVLVHNVRGHSVPGTIVCAMDDRAYLVEFSNGSRSVRNRRFLTFLPRDGAAAEMCPAVYQPPVRTRLENVADAAGTGRGVTDIANERTPGGAATRAGSAAVTGSPCAVTSRGTPDVVTEVPRQNPCSPPRPVIGVTRSGRLIVPTLRGLNR